MMENEIISIFMNYGIAGLILYVFYKMYTNELRELRKSIEANTQVIQKLINLIESKLK